MSKNQILIAKSLKTSSAEVETWDDNVPLGKKKLYQMLREMGANLTQHWVLYTNPSFRNFIILILINLILELFLNSRFSGHGIKSYCHEASANQKRNMSDAIHTACAPRYEILTFVTTTTNTAQAMFNQIGPWSIVQLGLFWWSRMFVPVLL